MQKRKALAIGGAAAVTLLMAMPAFAATTTTNTTKHVHAISGVIGKVSAVNGSTLTVTNKKGTAYTVDVSNATFQKGFGKNVTTIALTNIAVNDEVVVKGSVSGTSVTAKKVIDGVTLRSARAHMGRTLTNAAFGTIASVNGSTFTLEHTTKTATTTTSVTTTDSTTYKKNGQADTASDLAVGQRVVVMGTKDSSGNIAAATSVNIMVRTARTTSAAQ